MAKRQADRCRHQRRRIVDTVADKQRRCATGLGSSDGDLLLRRPFRIDLVDTDLLGKISNLTLSIARDNQNALQVMTRPKMRDKRSAVFAWCIVKLVRGRVST